jgi:alpha,alpha-trehalose phosphorylase
MRRGRSVLAAACVIHPPGCFPHGHTDTLAEQRAYLDELWDGADVRVEGDPQLQQAVRFALFHILQAGARAERRCLPAKGLTGPGYDGHTFWDSEAYVLPVLTYTQPQAAADALRWRHATLPLARQRAATLGLRGAKSPGAPSVARSPPATGRPAPPRSTSTPTSPPR